jgi:hypothetical protein
MSIMGKVFQDLLRLRRTRATETEASVLNTEHVSGVLRIGDKSRIKRGEE